MTWQCLNGTRKMNFDRGEKDPRGGKQKCPAYSLDNHEHQGDKIGAGGGFVVSKAGFEVALETFCHTSDAISLKSEGAIVSIAPKHGCSSFQIQIQKKTLTTTNNGWRAESM